MWLSVVLFTFGAIFIVEADDSWIYGDGYDKKYDEKSFYSGVAIGLDQKYDGKYLKVNEEEVTNKDNFIRPCSLDDWECIRRFLAHNSGCKPSYGPAPDPLYLAQNTVFFAVTNMTNTLSGVKVTGLSSAKVVEFYYNKITRDLVFAIEVKNLNETIKKSIYTYRRTAKESINLADVATVEFKSIVFTAIIPKIPKLRLDLAEIHADVRDPYPAFFVGPKAYTSKDPDVIEAYAQFVTLWPIIVREGFFTQAPLFTTVFIQKNVCDFGLKVNSV